MNEIIEELLYRYRRPRNRGRLEGEGVVSGAAGNPGCGDVVRVYLKVEDGKVVDARFEGEGCTISQSTADLLMDRIRNRTVDEVTAMGVDHIVEMIGEELVRMRPKCSTVSLSAVKTALRSIRDRSRA